MAAYRDVSGRGGYVYRQFGDGTIRILAGPARVGEVHTPGAQPWANPVWMAITAEIGPIKGHQSSFAYWQTLSAAGRAPSGYAAQAQTPAQAQAVAEAATTSKATRGAQGVLSLLQWSQQLQAGGAPAGAGTGIDFIGVGAGAPVEPTEPATSPWKPLLILGGVGLLATIAAIAAFGGRR